MRIWQVQSEIQSPRAEIMNAIVSGADEPPPYVAPLRMPRADGWEDGRVWLHWKMDEEMANGAGAAFGGYLAALADHGRIAGKATATQVIIPLAPREVTADM